MSIADGDVTGLGKLESKEAQFPTVNYIWFGPRSIRDEDVPGQDVNGPKAMLEANNDNPIVFWCLEKYEKDFKKEFEVKGERKVEVRSIESYVEDEIAKGSESAMKFKEIMAKLLQRGWRRDMVALKELFGLFVLVNEGGYLLDSNVGPEKGKRVRLKQYEKCRVPKLQNLTRGNPIECWMIFSPYAGHPTIKGIWEAYVKKSEELDAALDEKKITNETYVISLGPTSIRPIVEALDKKDGQMETWAAVAIDEDGSGRHWAVVDENLIKTYDNTHKWHRRKTFDSKSKLFQAVFEDERKCIAVKIAKDAGEYIMGEFLEQVAAASSTLPELNYWSFSLCQSVLYEIFHVIGPLPGQAGLGWNMLDAFCQGVEGIQQIRSAVIEKTTHRPAATAVKGGLNITSALQVAILSGISFATFGAPAFAAAFGVGFLLSLDDTVCAVRRYYDPTYHGEDNAAKDKKLEIAIQKLTREINELRSSSKRDNWVVRAVIRSKEGRLAALKEERLEIADEQKILAANGKSDGVGSYVLQSKLYKDVARKTSNGDSLTSNNRAELKKAMYEKLGWNILKAIKNNAHWGLAFAGMLLVCIPGFQPVGGFLIIAASALYFSKHALTLGNLLYKKKEEKEEKEEKEGGELRKAA